MFTYAVLSEVGEREINEDSVGFAPVGKDIGMVILADGLGGHGLGHSAYQHICGDIHRFAWCCGIHLLQRSDGTYA